MIIRVANIIEDGRFGGPQRRIAEVAFRLKDYDIETTVIYPKNNSVKFKKILTEYKIKQKQISLHRLTKVKKDLFLYFICFIYEIILLSVYLKKNHFDVIHISGGIWQIKGAIAGKLAGKKVLWHLNDTNTPKIIQILFKYIAKYCTDGFIVAGRRVKRVYIDDLHITTQPVFEIQAPVESIYYSPYKRVKRNNKIQIVTVGNINPTKNTMLFAQVAKILNRKYKNILTFKVAGELFKSQSKYINKLKNYINKNKLNNFYLLGGVNNVKGLLNEADIYICTSNFEASPTSVWEAMSMAKTIVSTDVGDVSRFIKDGKSGYIVETNNANAIVERIEKLIKDKNKIKNLGLHNREIVIHQFDILQIVNSHIQVYKTIIN